MYRLDGVNNNKSILILEGGAMRGLFSSAILDLFLDENIVFDTVVGVSAGAAFGCNYKSKQKGRAIRYNLRFKDNWRYSSLRSLLLTGNIYGAKFCYDTIPNKLDLFDTKTFSENPMKFIMVATDCETGNPYYYEATDGKEKDLLWMRASASMPIVSRRVKIDGRYYLDGGISDSIPYHYAKENGYEKIVVILTQPREYRKDETKSNSLIPLIYRGKNKGISERMKTRAKDYNDIRAEIFRDSEKGDVFVIAPDNPLGVKHIEKDGDKLLSCYNQGVSKGKELLESLKQYLVV